MIMNTSEHILVIILAAFLALFLLLAIVAIVEVLVLVRKVRKLVGKAGQVINSAESAAEVFKKVAGPVSALKILRSIVSAATQHKKDKRR
jgi:hypothetical protein